MAALDHRNPNLDDFLGLNWTCWVDRANILASDGESLCPVAPWPTSFKNVDCPVNYFFGNRLTERWSATTQTKDSLGPSAEGVFSPAVFTNSKK